MRFNSTFFKCLVCGSGHMNYTAESCICQECKQTYLVRDDIPILVRDWEQTDQMIEAAGEAKPGWYKLEQSTEAVSPWRHHLKKRRLYVEEKLREYLGHRKASATLDLGCGDGKHLDWLQKYSHELFGSDYNLLRLVRANAVHPQATLFLADVLDYPAKDNFYEIIFFNHVIEHIPDDGAALREIFRILKPGGLLVLGTPNEGRWWWQLAYRLQPNVLKVSDHVHFYTSETLIQTMEQHGFSITEVKHIGWGPPHWSLDRRIRGHKILDDAFETVGSRLFPRQASSLYVLATKA
jgi:ubiquinone/menaquinone biosynthesis C-methylase UbiE